MKIDVPYDYINILLFKTLLKYENKRSVSIDMLDKYHQVLLEEIINDYERFEKAGKITYFSDKEKWEGEIEFVFNGETIDAFLEKFPDLFYRDDDNICLYEEVSFDELEQRKIVMQNDNAISRRFDHASENDRLLDLLNIKRIKSIIEKYVSVEEKIETFYSKIGDGSDNISVEELKKLLMMRAIFLNNVCQYSGEVVDAFRMEGIRKYNNDSSYDYSRPPINLDLWKKSEYYVECVEDTDDIFSDIDDRIYDIYQYAIFGKNSLAIQKTSQMLENLCFSDERDNATCEEVEDYFSSDDNFNEKKTYFVVDNEECDLVFYLTYLQKLNDYMDKNGETGDLVNTKNRLMYALDMPKLGLFRIENFERECENICDYDIDEEDFEFVEDEARFMADEVFKVEEDDNTVKKLLFISTYYELTGDEAIPLIVNEHEDDDRFDTYSEVIFGEQSDKEKKMQLKP